EADRVRAAWDLWREREQDLARQRARTEAAAREADFLRASVEELTGADPQPGEEAELAERRSAMMRAERSAADIAEAQDVLSGPASPVPALSGMLRRLERKAAEAPGLLEEIVAALDEALVSLDAAQAAVDGAMREAEPDPRRLEETEERLFALRAL